MAMEFLDGVTLTHRIAGKTVETDIGLGDKEKAIALLEKKGLCRPIHGLDLPSRRPGIRQPALRPPPCPPATADGLAEIKILRANQHAVRQASIPGESQSLIACCLPIAVEIGDCTQNADSRRLNENLVSQTHDLN